MGFFAPMAPNTHRSWLPLRAEDRDLGLSHHKGGATSRRPSLVPRSSKPIQLRQINVTEMLLVVSVRVSDVNWTVIGGLHSGENVAVAVSV